MQSYLLLVTTLFLSRATVGHCFVVFGTTTSFLADRASRGVACSLTREHGDDDAPSVVGDPLRAATGVRPSLHPTTINALADALLLRAKYDDDGGLRVNEARGVRPLDVALRAGRIASEALDRRQRLLANDGNSDVAAESYTEEECGVVAGRIMGVVMRLDELETALIERVRATKWVAKYGEYDSFGVEEIECEANDDDEDKSRAAAVHRVRTDPLFRMTRAECLLAVFIATVEIPKTDMLGEKLVDASKVDFIDEDRKMVLCPNIT